MGVCALRIREENFEVILCTQRVKMKFQLDV